MRNKFPHHGLRRAGGFVGVDDVSDHRIPLKTATLMFACFGLLISFLACATTPKHTFDTYDDLQSYFATTDSDFYTPLFCDADYFTKSSCAYEAYWWKGSGFAGCRREEPSGYCVYSELARSQTGTTIQNLTISALLIDELRQDSGWEPYLPPTANIIYRGIGVSVETGRENDTSKDAAHAGPKNNETVYASMRFDIPPCTYEVSGSVSVEYDGRLQDPTNDLVPFPEDVRNEFLGMLNSFFDQAGVPLADDTAHDAFLTSEVWMAQPSQELPQS